MNTGLPGTGIGGLFYMISVLVMVLIEIKGILLRKKNGKRKNIVMEQSIIIVLLIGAIYATNVFFSKYVFKKPPLYLAVNSTFSEKASYVIINYPIIIPLSLLILVILFTQSMYLLLKSSQKK